MKFSIDALKQLPIFHLSNQELIEALLYVRVYVFFLIFNL